MIKIETGVSVRPLVTVTLNVAAPGFSLSASLNVNGQPRFGRTQAGGGIAGIRSGLS
jgi:hypothetical protein